MKYNLHLQLLIDVLMSDGHPSSSPTTIPAPHLPILACNMDLQWMAEAVMPRFGHGAFLLCLENLYKKVTGRDMVYTALIGKPSEITYRHAEHVLQQMVSRHVPRDGHPPRSLFQAVESLGLSQPVKTVYCIGDNVCTDIFGANLYNNYLRNRRLDTAHLVSSAAGAPEHSCSSRSIDRLVGTSALGGAETCFSVLVETGQLGSSLNDMLSFRASVCSNFDQIGDCCPLTSNLTIDYRSFQ